MRNILCLRSTESVPSCDNIEFIVFSNIFRTLSMLEERGLNLIDISIFFYLLFLINWILFIQLISSG